jgi:hypothetical protein
MSAMNSVPLPFIHSERRALLALPEFAETELDRIVDLTADALSWEIVSAFWRHPHKSTFEVEATTRMLTSIGEHLGERSVDRIEAAAFYRVTMHASWRQAATRWFNAADTDAISTFIDRNPEYAQFVAQHASLYPPEESLG